MTGVAAAGNANDALAHELTALEGATVERFVSAASLCTYRVGGPIDILLRVENVDALASAIAVLRDHGVPVLAIGKGSNLLIADAGFAGVGVVLGEGFAEIDVDGTRVTAGAGASLPVVARTTVAAGLAGFAWAVGVPGSIGGAVRMNAGGHGSDMAACLVAVDVADLGMGGIVSQGIESLDLGYRTSSITAWQIVVSAILELTPDVSNAGPDELREIVAWRRANQPGGPNAGSVFTNPPDESAGRLIDAAGLKGYRIGSAEVSKKHANFIQADPDGSADDVARLMVQIVDRVNKETGIQLHAETRLVGFGDELVDHVQASPTSPTSREDQSDG